MTKLESLKEKCERLQFRLDQHKNAVKSLEDFELEKLKGLKLSSMYNHDEIYLNRFTEELNWCNRKLGVMNDTSLTFENQYKEIEDKLTRIISCLDKRFYDGIPFQDIE